MHALLRGALNLTYLFALGCWGGAVVFLIGISTPTTFGQLDRDAAARVLGSVFPRFFALSLICICLALAVAVLRLWWGTAPRRVAATSVVLLSLALALVVYVMVALLPEMARAQAQVGSFVTTPTDAPARLAYGRLHGQSMIVNAVAALLGGATLILAACNPTLLTWPPRGAQPEVAPDRATAQRAARTIGDLPSR